MLDHQDKHMMKAQVHVSKSSTISDIRPLPRGKHYFQIYQMVKHMLRMRLLASFQDHEHEGGDTRSVDEDDMDMLPDQPIQKKRRRDDHDKDPSPDADKDSKKKKKKDPSASSSKKIKDQPPSSKVDEVINVDDHSQYDSAPCQDRSKWFKQSPRPNSPDPK
nr:hypothetical protein [Tanacetum cinerariifolium]